MPGVIWSAPSLEDVRSIESWLERAASPDFAIRTLTRILRVLGTPYLIHYQISNQEVEVLRVHHEREDWFVSP